MTSSTEPTATGVVVGVDFSKGSAAAVEYAAAVAARRQLALVLMFAVDTRTAPLTYLAMTMEEVQEEAESELADLARTLVEDHPGLAVSTHFVAEPPVHALVDASRRAAMVVLGSRGHGGFGQLLLGSVAWRVVAEAGGPVVLVRPGDLLGRPASGPVLVAIDGTETCSEAVQFAFDEASSRRTTLIAVTVWTVPLTSGLAATRDWPARPVQWEPERESDAERLLAEALAGKAERFPDVAVERHVTYGVNVPETLLELAGAKNADLVVVGAGSRRPVAELVLGAVGVQLSHHADRTVAVVPSPWPSV